MGSTLVEDGRALVELRQPSWDGQQALALLGDGSRSQPPAWGRRSTSGPAGVKRRTCGWAGAHDG